MQLKTTVDGVDVYDKRWTMLDVCRWRTAAYYIAFNPANIQSGFDRFGLHSFNLDRLFKNGLPMSQSNLSTICSFEASKEMYDEKYRTVEQNSVYRTVSIYRGYVDTRWGVTLTSKEAIDAAKHSAEARREREQKKQKDAADRKERKKARLAARAEKKQAKMHAISGRPSTMWLLL